MCQASVIFRISINNYTLEHFFNSCPIFTFSTSNLKHLPKAKSNKYQQQIAAELISGIVHGFQ
ncbi:unnamed protein product [Paramecium sonneborni]|uniref:Uncharacterized protein n=1 Tax=Paramecium sonneborni TaxID=65129 RepID=A0A8S1RTL1_9CILI|nr:unnamed protein product [Paramecium sonneborni]